MDVTPFPVGGCHDANLVRSREHTVCVDARMRAAYGHWSQHCRDHNIPTTPAYDVVGLLAVLQPDKFQQRAGGGVLSLNDEYRGPGGFQRADYLSRRSEHQLIVVTDYGEECDDEVTCLLVPPSSKLVFTDDDQFDQNVAQYRTFGGQCSVHHVSELGELLDTDSKNIVLQIGPVHEAAHGRIDDMISCKIYDWYLVGTLGGTLNSKGDAQNNAELLQHYAHSAYIVDTDRGNGAFPLTYTQLTAALTGRITDDQLERVAEHVIKIGWRNTVGRANPCIGKFIAHLVVQNVGANYQTVDTVLHACRSEEDSANIMMATPAKTRAEATQLAHNYLERLQTTAPDMLDPEYDAVDDGTFHLKGSPDDSVLQPGNIQFRVPHTDVKPQKFRLLVDGAGTTNSVARVTAGQIVDGYTFMLVVLHQVFDVPLEFWESGQPGTWHPQWENPGPIKDGEVAEHPFVKTI